MGEILSTIGKWIKTRYEEVTSTLKEAWGVVKSVVEGVMDVVRRVVDAVSCFRYTNETVWVQSETTGAGGDTRKTRVEAGRAKLTIGTAKDNQPTAPLKLPSDMMAGNCEKAKEEIRQDIKLYKQNQKDVMTVVDKIEELLKPGQRDSRKTELQKLQNLRKMPAFKNVEAIVAKQPVVNPALA